MNYKQRIMNALRDEPIISYDKLRIKIKTIREYYFLTALQELDHDEIIRLEDEYKDNDPKKMFLLITLLKGD